MRATTHPILIRKDASESVLTRISLGKDYDEAWLQTLIANHPELLPVAEIEPAFERLIPAGREIACGHGYIDNLYLTAAGRIVMVETKLYSNPQARREVVAQALDYVAALTRMPYEEFEQAVCAALHNSGKPSSLYDLVRNSPESIDEQIFFDAVSTHLKRGEILVLVVGDGIRREAENLAYLLQSHAGARFTFALVELATYQTNRGDLLVVPSTLLKTLMIERGVVRIEKGIENIVVQPVSVKTEQAAKEKPRGLTEIEFDDLINARSPGLAGHIRQFITSLEPLGIYAQIKNTALYLYASIGGEPVNLGYIWKNGQFYTDQVYKNVPPDLLETYLANLAEIIDGQVGSPNGRSEPLYVQIKGKTSFPWMPAFLPEHADELRTAMQQFVHQLLERKSDG